MTESEKEREGEEEGRGKGGGREKETEIETERARDRQIPDTHWLVSLSLDIEPQANKRVCLIKNQTRAKGAREMAQWSAFLLFVLPAFPHTCTRTPRPPIHRRGSAHPDNRLESAQF